MSIQKQRIFLVVIAFFFIFFGFDGGMQYIVALYSREGIQHLAFNSQIILYSVIALTTPYMARVINAISLKRAIQLGAITYLLFILGLLSKNPTIIYFFAILIGLGASLLWVSSRQLIAVNSSKEELGKYLSFHFSSFIFGGLGGTIVGAFLLNRVPFSFLYIFFSSAIFCSLPILFFIKPTVEKLAVPKFNPHYAFKSHILLLAPLFFVASFLLVQAQNGMTVVILSRFGIHNIGVIATVFRVTMAVASLCIGYLSMRVKLEKLLIALSVIGLIGMVLFVSSFNLAIVCISVMLIGVFVSSAQTQGLSFVRRIVDKEENVYVISAFQMYQSMGILTALGIVKYFNAIVSFIPGIILIAISIPLVWLFKRKFSPSN